MNINSYFEKYIFFLSLPLYCPFYMEIDSCWYFSFNSIWENRICILFRFGDFLWEINCRVYILRELNLIGYPLSPLNYKTFTLRTQFKCTRTFNTETEENLSFSFKRELCTYDSFLFLIFPLWKNFAYVVTVLKMYFVKVFTLWYFYHCTKWLCIRLWIVHRVCR